MFLFLPEKRFFVFKILGSHKSCVELIKVEKGLKIIIIYFLIIPDFLIFYIAGSFSILIIVVLYAGFEDIAIMNSKVISIACRIS